MISATALVQQQALPRSRPGRRPVYRPETPSVRQTGSWQCSACSLAWMLRSIGREVTQENVVALLGPARIDPQHGLLDGSGAGLAEVLRGLGLPAGHGWLDFDALLTRAGRQPLAIGGAGWYHWSGVRGRDGDRLLLANPAPGWKGVQEALTRQEFTALGPFAAVWIEAGDQSAPSRPELPPIDASSPRSFVESVLPYARIVAAESGLPASIMVAMACNETGYGRYALGNNFFGIKADPSWTGPTTGEVETWEDYGQGRVEIRDVFRAYPDPADSFRDFARFLNENPRYRAALACKSDPLRFITEIWRAGYATDPEYPTKIMRLVADCGLA